MTEFLTQFSDALLFMAHEKAIAAIFLIGFIFHDRTLWGVAILSLSFTMVLNPALKQLFHLPLPMGMTGYAFPSGHFHCAIAFYGWIAYMWPNRWVRGAIALLLAGIGFALVYRGYHYIRDVFGALGFGCLIIWATARVMKVHPFKSWPPTIGGLFLALCGGLLLFMKARDGIPMNAWVGLSLLGGLTALWMLLFWYLKDKKSTGKKFSRRSK